MRIATLDLETTPSPAGLARLTEKRGSRASAEKTAKDAALSPLYGQVVSVALATARGAMVSTLGQAGSEEALLRWAAEQLADVDLVVTFNGASFDVPYLRTRLVVHGIWPAPACLDQRRYHVTPHLDLRMWLVDWDQYASGDLSEWCAALGVACPGKDMGITGADVAPMAAAGRWEEIGQYNLGDAQATWALLERCWPLVRSEIPGAEGRTLAEVTAPPAPVAPLVRGLSEEVW